MVALKKLVTSLNAKQVRARKSKTQKTALALRQHLWPDITDDMLWLRGDERRKGFTTIPRTMPLFMEAIGDASKHVSTGSKAVPAGRTYLSLWCRVYDEGLVRIDNEKVAAAEAGYAGERSVSTWREHMRVLKDLGFIDIKSVIGGEFQHVLLLNPYHAVMKLKRQGLIQERLYDAIYQRALEIGATDIRDGLPEDAVDDDDTTTTTAA